MIYAFAGYEVDDALYEVRKSGERIPISPRVFDTVLFLIRNQHRVVTKDELVEGVWAGTTVTDDALNQAIRKARRALGGSHAIQTVRGRGYRFAAGHQAAGCPASSNAAPSNAAPSNAAPSNAAPSNAAPSIHAVAHHTVAAQTGEVDASIVTP